MPTPNLLNPLLYNPLVMGGMVATNPNPKKKTTEVKGDVKLNPVALGGLSKTLANTPVVPNVAVVGGVTAAKGATNNKKPTTTTAKEQPKKASSTSTKKTTSTKQKTPTVSAGAGANAGVGTGGAVTDGLQNYLDTIYNSLNQNIVQPDVVANTPMMDVITPTLRGIEELASMYGIKYDYNELLNQFNNAVETQYDAIYGRQEQSEGKYYDNAATAQNTLLDTLAKNNSAAISTGVNKGMQASNALSSLLGVSQQFADNATALSQERSNIANDYGAALAKAQTDARAEEERRREYISSLARQLYADEGTMQGNQLLYNSNIDANNAARYQAYQNSLDSINQIYGNGTVSGSNNYITTQGNLMGNQMTADANRYAADQGLAGTRYAADQNYAGTQYAANQNASSSRYAADQGAAAQRYYADAMRENSTGGNSGLSSNREVQEAIRNGTLASEQPRYNNILQSQFGAIPMGAQAALPNINLYNSFGAPANKKEQIANSLSKFSLTDGTLNTKDANKTAGKFVNSIVNAPNNWLKNLIY